MCVYIYIYICIHSYTSTVWLKLWIYCDLFSYVHVHAM